MRRHDNLDIPLNDTEKAELKAAADAQALPLATWARAVLQREARKGAS